MEQHFRNRGTPAILERSVEKVETEPAAMADRCRRLEKELSALKRSARAVLEPKGFGETARAIFDHCRNLIGATAGYVALLSPAGSENEVLFLEAGGLACDVDPGLPMPIRGLRAESYASGKPVYHNDFMSSQWVRYLPTGHVALRNVMFAPLNLGGRTVGIMGLANKPADFDDSDAETASAFGELAAIALKNSRDTDARNQAAREQEKLVAELKEALAKVKQLRGLIPMCSSCRQIRDDDGYWKQVEAYIQEHTDAAFSHSICPKCADTHYPELHLYDD